MKIIPAIDIYNGQVVRLKKGDYQQKTEYSLTPFEQAEKFKLAGFGHIHIIDLNGAKEGKFVNLDIIEQIIEKLGLSVQTGGGVRTFQDVERLITIGISGVICSSMVINNRPDWIRALDKYADKMILGLDLKGGKMAYGGWLETSDESIESVITPFIEQGLTKVLSTDISKDGMLQGPNITLYKEMQRQFPEIKLIASGGVASAADITDLAKLEIYGVVVGKAIYEGRISLEELTTFL